MAPTARPHGRLPDHAAVFQQNKLGRQERHHGRRQIDPLGGQRPVDQRIWEEATREAWQLARKGITIPLQDLVIAACANRIEAAILTYDNHFFDIPGVTVLSSLDELR
jgi:predicted nucleic acid-binding protein